ncbi:Mg-chelatase subunit ChlI [Methanococcus voltae]|uniref:Mg-chelatase subunit ChlI n=1 Tax=Methanococcus voltae TaxID=2188 RepID=A0A8J7UT62_METVO|nr:ATP-binding protein [Methanococcus voltae]MBP2201308.1 Mg-chelatase subunit ChlI [Methanococcus voltae]
MAKNFHFPFTAIEGQEEMKKALLLNAINPSIGGVLIRGEKGTAKSTTVRSLTDILPKMEVMDGCIFSCDPNGNMCDECLSKNKPYKTTFKEMKVVTLPIGSTEDRVIGTIDIEKAIKEGIKSLDKGILADANRNILYLDEVNLLDDHIVDILLDAAAMGWNTIEREGINIRHPSKFILVGTMNPEEGELRPQILDRFGLMVNVDGLMDVKKRVNVIKKVEEFNLNPKIILEEYSKEQNLLREQIGNARKILPTVKIENDLLEFISQICIEMNIPTNRADITVARTAKTIAALNQRDYVIIDDIKEACELALPHRMRRKPFDPPTLNNEKLEQFFDDFENENNEDKNQDENENNENNSEEDSKN